jgi:3-oxoacyl-[acyl-carrier protein] reductase
LSKADEFEVVPEYVVVTGANGGIGRCVSMHLARHGYSLILCTRANNADFTSWATDLQTDYGIDVQFVHFDFSKAQDVKEASISIAKKYKISSLVNCAGIPFGATILMTKIEDLKTILDVNFTHQVLFTQQILRTMCSRKRGSIVNIASMSALNADAGTLAYGASKAALIHFTRVAAAESGKFGVRVNAVSPGAIETEMLNLMDDVALEKLRARSALMRFGKPEEVASAVLFLISDESSYISGEIMKINGGEK